MCHAQACVKGIRMPFHRVVRRPAMGDTIEDLPAECPFLSREGLMGALSAPRTDWRRSRSRPSRLRTSWWGHDEQHLACGRRAGPDQAARQYFTGLGWDLMPVKSTDGFEQILSSLGDFQGV